MNARCWDLIDSHTTQVIRSESFLHLSHAQLGDIVRRSTLCVEEIDLYERVVQWARTQLERAREEPTPAAIRGVLGDVLFSIRFPLMGAADFSHEVAKSAILTAEEVVEVFLWRTIRDKPTSFSCEPRGVQQSAAILNGSASPSPQAIDDPTTIPDNYLENGDWCARGLFVTVRPVYEYAGLLYLEGVILSAAGANNDAYFRGTCTRSIPRKYLLPVRPNVGDAARIIYGEDVGLRGNVISLDGPEAVLKMDSGVRLIPLNFLCKVA